jgi:hypothetical protein
VDWDAQSIIGIIIALNTLVTTIGGTFLAIKQSSIKRGLDDAKQKAIETAQAVERNAQTRTEQIEDVKKTVIQKVDELKT